MKILIVLSIVTFLLLLYAVWGREWLKTKSWAVPFFERIEPIEIFLFKKSETILFARLKVLLGLVLMFLAQLGSIDLTPLMPLVPEKHRGIVLAVFNMIPLALSIIGMMDERLRNTTTKPLELVAIPDKVVAQNPIVAEAVAMADTTKTEAVAVVNEAKKAT